MIRSMMARLVAALALLGLVGADLVHARGQAYPFRPAAQRQGGFVQLLAANASPIASIASSGWQATWATGTPPTFAPDASPQTVTVSRQGYSSALSPTTYTEQRIFTARVRQAFPNQATLTASTVALDDYVYATDSIAGVTNNSAETSPKPIANFATIDQKVIGNTIGGTAVPFEVVAFHRDGIAGVRFSISDGSTTITVDVSTPSVSPNATDVNKVTVYALPTTSISALADQAVVTVNAQVFPRIGGAASVLNSTDSAVAREFSPRYFFRHVARATNPVYVYVNATTGVNATVLASGATSGGVQKVSTNPATAAANPFQTIVSANDALRAATSLTGGLTSGCVIRIQGTVPFTSNFTTNTYQNANGGALIIEPDPNDATATVTFGTGATPNTRGSATLWRNIRITRTGTLAFINADGVRWEGVTLDNGSNNAALSSGFVQINGATITNASTAILSAGATGQMRLLRGLNISGAATALEAWLVLGGNLANGGSVGDLSTRPATGGIVAFNTVYRLNNAVFDMAQSYAVNQFALVGNVFEYITTGTTIYNRLSGDSSTGSMSHVVVAGNSFAGFDLYGRSNWAYTDGLFATGAQSRVYKLWRVQENIFSQMNVKGDVFVGGNGNGTPDPTNAPNAVGNWPVKYGVGWSYNWVMYRNANGDGNGQASSFGFDFPGLATQTGTSNTARLDPLFTTWAATTNSGATPIAGTGGGTYTLQAGSPALGIVPAGKVFVPFDLAGAVRDRGAVGAYR